jgi:hypothetical protein
MEDTQSCVREPKTDAFCRPVHYADGESEYDEAEAIRENKREGGQKGLWFSSTLLNFVPTQS